MSYIPTKEADFVSWSENLIAVSAAHVAEWNLNEDRLADLLALHTEVKRLHGLCQTSLYTKVDMRAKNLKKKQLFKLEEVFVRNNLQNNDLMTDIGREELRIPIHDTTPSQHADPDSVPDLEVETPHPRTVLMRFRAVNAARWGKPGNVHGMEGMWVLSGTPPTKIEDLLHSVFSTRSPLEMVFDEDQRGKRMYFAVRWENGVGKKGPWSEIFSVIIP
jgi:hypothetical protein